MSARSFAQSDTPEVEEELTTADPTLQSLGPNASSVSEDNNSTDSGPPPIPDEPSIFRPPSTTPAPEKH